MFRILLKRNIMAHSKLCNKYIKWNDALDWFSYRYKKTMIFHCEKHGFKNLQNAKSTNEHGELKIWCAGWTLTWIFDSFFTKKCLNHFIKNLRILDKDQRWFI